LCTVYMYPLPLYNTNCSHCNCSGSCHQLLGFNVQGVFIDMCAIPSAIQRAYDWEKTTATAGVQTGSQCCSCAATIAEIESSTSSGSSATTAQYAYSTPTIPPIPSKKRCASSVSTVHTNVNVEGVAFVKGEDKRR
jgi:hypothetical protein